MKSLARIAAILMLLLLAPVAWAATIQVNTTADLFMDAGACSLRDAIESFNNLGAPVSGGCSNSSADAFGTNDTILLPAGQYNLTIPGSDEDDNASGDLDIEPTVVSPLKIVGADPNDPTATVIDALMLNPRDRVLHIVGMFPVTTLTPVILDAVTIQNGQAPDIATFGKDGGGVFVGISGCLDLLNSVVRMNRAGNGQDSFSPGAQGGGIAFHNSTGPCGLNISNSLIEDNQAGNGILNANGFPGYGGNGGGILSFAVSFTMDETTVRNNHAGDGAANTGAAFSGVGGSGAQGGGLYFFIGGINGGTALITHSTISGNTAGDGGNAAMGNGGFGGAGGGIHAAGLGSGTGTFTLINSTVSGNRAGDAGDSNSNTGGSGGDGGGIFWEQSIMGEIQDVTLNNLTIADNAAGLGGTGPMSGVDGNGGGLAFFSSPTIVFPDTFSIANTIFANTVGATGTGPNCFLPGTSGTSGVTDSGFNLETGTDCEFTLTGDKQNANPNLGPLQDNGGPTFTHALLAGSDALDMGNNTAAPGSGFSACEADDQRMISRPQGSACDIGAFEAQTADLAVTKTVSSAEVEEDSTLEFTLTVTNNGPDDADFVLLEDALPPGVSFISATPEQGVCQEAAGTVNCDLGTIPAGGTVAVLIEALANVNGNYTNTAIVSFPGIDSDPSNDSASVDFIIAGGGVSGSGCALQEGNATSMVGILWIAIGILILGSVRRHLTDIF